MIKRFLFFVLFVFCFSLTEAQGSFEGTIKFSTIISVTDNAPDGFFENLNYKYGDGLIMYYSHTGKFRRVHLNSGEYGADSQYYFPEQAKIYFTYKNLPEIDSLDVQESSVSLTKRRKIASERILNLECDCYEYEGRNIFNQEDVLLTYCYNTTTPEIDPRFFSEHHDFFLDDYYAQTRRPYLKFSIETLDFKISYIASKLTEARLDDSIFKFSKE